MTQFQDISLRRVVAEFYSKVKVLNKYHDFTKALGYQFKWCKNPKLTDRFVEVCQELGLEYVGHGASRVAFKWNNFILKFDTNFDNSVGKGSQNEQELKTYNKFKGTDVQYLMIPIYGYIKLQNHCKVIVTKPVVIENCESFHNDRVNGCEFCQYMKEVITATFFDIHHENLAFVFNGMVTSDFSGGAYDINYDHGNGLCGLKKLKCPEWQAFKDNYLKDLRCGCQEVAKIA